MSDIGETARHLWPWAASGLAGGAGLWRWWRGRIAARTEPRPSDPARWEDAEQSLFPRDGSSPRPGRGLARLVTAPFRLYLKEAGEAALEEETAGLRDDLRRALADNRRLRAELDSLSGSNGGSTSTPGARSPRRKPPSPRSPRSGG